MLDSLKMRIAQVSERVHSSGWHATFRELMFFRRTAVIIEKDLSEVGERSAPLVKRGLRVSEIDHSMLASGEYHFAIRSRFYKALKYLNQGYGGFALVRDHLIVGDSWHWMSDSATTPGEAHADLRRFGFSKWNKADAYTFDLFVAPHERKSGVSAAFQNSVMLSLRAKGCRKTLAFYWADNLRAYWCHQASNKWKEVRRVRVSRCLMLMKSSLIEGKRNGNDVFGQARAGCMR